MPKRRKLKAGDVVRWNGNHFSGWMHNFRDEPLVIGKFASGVTCIPVTGLDGSLPFTCTAAAPMGTRLSPWVIESHVRLDPFLTAARKIAAKDKLKTKQKKERKNK